MMIDATNQISRTQFLANNFTVMQESWPYKRFRAAVGCQSLVIEENKCNFYSFLNNFEYVALSGSISQQVYLYTIEMCFNHVALINVNVS
jgi:hypothetical protein